MALSITNFFLMFFLVSTAFECHLCSSKNDYVIKEPETAKDYLHHNTHSVQLNTLLPKSFCQSRTREMNKGSSIDVIHKHGPCNDHQKVIVPTPNQILVRDEMRVSSINKRIFMNCSTNHYMDSKLKRIMQTKYRIDLGSADYIVTIGLGTPERMESSFIIDTTSDLTWLRCRKIRSKKKYVPRWSTSYVNVSSNSSSCYHLNSSSGIWSTNYGEGSSPCEFELRSRNRRFSSGFLSRDRLTLTQDNIFNFTFGCSYPRNEHPGKADGILGLGTHKISIVNQTAKTYEQVFSYCLPSVSSYTGYLRFGKKKSSDTVKYTPLVIQNSTFYALNIIGISVGGDKLPVTVDAIVDTPAIIDSGTEITKLPRIIYDAMKKEFMRRMNFPTISRYLKLDACYDVRGYDSITVPTISIHFEGGSNLDIHPSGILYMVNQSQVCLAFAKNPSKKNVIILGNMMQKTSEVIFDVGNRRLGFEHGSCN